MHGGCTMNKRDFVGEFLTELQGILEKNIYDLDSTIKGDIKAEADEALSELLEKYKLLEEEE